MFSTPILLLIFNRPETTKKVFAEIRKQRPEYLYIAADGPRGGNERDIEKCKQCLEIVGNIDWDCKVKTLFRDKNLGCGAAPAQAITWFFENVEQGIILEDDILPDQSFFPFCEQMLDKFKNDEQVMHISGSYFLKEFLNAKTAASYYYTKHIHVWGWATWRYAWKNYDYDMKDWERLDSVQSLKKFYGPYYLFWQHIFSAKKKRAGHDIWDYQWMLSIYKCNGIAVNPTENLTINIGFDSDATHTTDENSIYNKVGLSSIDVLTDNNTKVIDEERDGLYYKYFLNFDPEYELGKRKLTWKLKNYSERLNQRLKKIFR